MSCKKRDRQKKQSYDGAIYRIFIRIRYGNCFA